jgi:glutamyl-tRNA reductase
MGFSALKEDKYYLHVGWPAFEHICLVTAGMLSQTPGENHITAQMKEALECGKQRGWAGNMIQEWISTALHVSKSVKNEVSPLLNNYEIESLALRYIEAAGRDISDATIMVLGTGAIGRGLVKESLSRAGKIIWCYHVNTPEIPENGEDRIELCTFNDMKNRITESDVIISAADAPGHVLHMAHAPFFNQERPVLAIDLGMPRNIDPELDDLSSDVTIVDLDGLKYWYRRELTDMDDIFMRCRAIITDNKKRYEKIAHSFKNGQERM